MNHQQFIREESHSGSIPMWWIRYHGPRWWDGEFGRRPISRAAWGVPESEGK